MIKYRNLIMIFSLFVIMIYFIALKWLLSIRGVKLNDFKKEAKNLIKRNKEYEYIETVDTTNKTFIGTSSGNKKIYTSDNAKHIFVAGTTGSGKSVALSNYIKTAVQKDYPLLIIDGKGDVGNGSILDIVKRLKGNKKLYVINMTNSESSDSYNPFKGANYTVCKDMLINMTNWSEEHYKLNSERYIQRLIKLMVQAGIELTFEAIVSYMGKDNFQKLSAELSKDDIISKDEHKANMALVKESGDIANSASARFSTIYESTIGHIFKNDGVDVYQALQERAIMLFILNPLSYPELSPLMGRLVLIDCKKAISNLYQENKHKRIFFIFDEINVYISEALINLLNKSRSANVTCIPATQSLSDLSISGGDELKDQIIENCNNYIILRQNTARSSEEWSKIIGTRQTMDITFQIEQHSEVSTATGVGSARRVREFIYHPDEIKSLKTGEAFYISKDDNIHSKIKVNKPF